MNSCKTHKDLDVWNLGIDLVEHVYKVTVNFPKEELYGLVSQIRRCAVSIPANIAEGAARHSVKEYIRFCNYSDPLGEWFFTYENNLPIFFNRLPRYTAHRVGGVCRIEVSGTLRRAQCIARQAVRS